MPCATWTSSSLRADDPPAEVARARVEAEHGRHGVDVRPLHLSFRASRALRRRCRSPRRRSARRRGRRAPRRGSAPPRRRARRAASSSWGGTPATVRATGSWPLSSASTTAFERVGRRSSAATLRRPPGSPRRRRRRAMSISLSSVAVVFATRMTPLRSKAQPPSRRRRGRRCSSRRSSGSRRPCGCGCRSSPRRGRASPPGRRPS